jgi:hypothetical protein
LPNATLYFTLTTPTHYITTTTTTIMFTHHRTALPLLVQSSFYFSFLDFTFYTRFVLSCLKTHNNNAKSSPTISPPPQIKHIIFQGLGKKWMHTSVHGQGVLE